MNQPRVSTADDKTASRPKVAVVGLGCLQLSEGCDLVACTRHPLSSLLLDLPAGSIDVHLRTLTDPSEATPVDWVLLSTKAHETPSTAPWLQHLCSPSTRVAVLQNGIDHADRVASIIAGLVVVPTIVYFNAERLSSRHVRLRQANDNDLVAPDDSNGAAFARLFDGTVLRTTTKADFTTLLWRKLLLNAVANPITTLTRQRLAVLHHPEIQALCHQILEEGSRVARAHEIPLPPDEADRVLGALLSYPPDAGTSMYFDCLAGRPLEIEVLTGAIVKAGERLGVATPINRMLLALLRSINADQSST
jgi:2-dehydropantoate 2-reductase